MQEFNNFSIFSAAHLATLGVIFGAAICCIAIARNKRTRHWTPLLSRGLVIILLSNELIFISLSIAKGLWSYKWGLPLQICDVAIFTIAYSLIRHKQIVWELAYFWGLGGTLQAILTPDLAVAFPSYMYVKFFITHGCIVIGVLYLSAGLGRSVNFQSVKNVWLITNAYTVFILIFNGIFKTNYLYLCAKPAQKSMMDLFGPWPYYIIGLEVIMTISLLLYYLPYYVTGKMKEK